MFRDLLSSRLIQAGLAFFVIVVGGGLLYRWHAHRTTEAEFGKRPQAVVSPLKNRDPSTNTAPSTGQAASIESTVLGKQDSDTVNTTNTGQDQRKNNTNTQQDKSLEEASVSEIEAEIIAEEEKAEEALSAEELRIQELKKRKNALLAEWGVIIESEGGGITPNSPLAVRQESTRILKELADIQQEIDGVPTSTLNHIVTMSQLVNNALNDKGEVSIAGYAKLADYIETTGDVELANEMRALVQVAVDHGSETIKPEHLNLFRK